MRRLFQSTPPCAGGDCKLHKPFVADLISIHAPLCGGRRQKYYARLAVCYFNPRPPVRGATYAVKFSKLRSSYFNPRPPVRGATVDAIHGVVDIVFQSTPPVRGATVIIAEAGYIIDFNPRPPVRGATLVKNAADETVEFQSTPPCAGGDQILRKPARKEVAISIHAPLCGGRQRFCVDALTVDNFNPRPPVRGATFNNYTISQQIKFQSTPPCAGGDSLRR